MNRMIPMRPGILPALVTVVTVLSAAGIAEATGRDCRAPDPCTQALPITERDFDVGVGYIPPEDMPRTETFPFIQEQDVAEVILFQRAVDWDGSRGIFEDLEELVGLARAQGFKIFLAQDAIQVPRDYAGWTGCQRGEPGPFPATWYEEGNPDYVPPDERNFGNEQIREAFIDYQIRLARAFRPEYLSMGVEVDMYAFPCFPFPGLENYPNPDAALFVDAFQEGYNLLHQILPDATLFTTFQYTQIGGVLIVGAGGLVNARWEFIRSFEPRIDAVGLSDFPDTVYFLGGPSQIASNWYSDIVDNQRTDLPIIFSEIGWPSRDLGGSPERQQAFISRFLELGASLDRQLVIWWFLADPTGESLSDHFYSMGLFQKTYPNIVPKPALGDWQELFLLPGPGLF